MLVHTTLTGQLGLLMLLEHLHENNIHVLSANTDGINVRVNKAQKAYVNDLVKWWCNETGFVMDYNHYKSISYRDVNNYFYVHQTGYTKGIGVFAGDGIRKSPDNPIIRDAIFEFTKNGVSIEDTVYNCTDPFNFLTLQKVTGGAEKDGELLGGTVRWYRSNVSETCIRYVKANKHGTFNQVAGSECGVPLMNVGETVPDDLDYDWYVQQAYILMAQVGIFDDATKLRQCAGHDDKEIFFEEIGVTKAMIKKYNIKM